MRAKYRSIILAVVLGIGGLVLLSLAVGAQASITANPVSINATPPNASTNTPVTITVSTITSGEGEAGTSGPYFRYYVNENSYCTQNPANWVLIQDWTTSPSAVWTPTANGRKTLMVWVTEDVASNPPKMIGTSYEVGSADGIDSNSLSLGSADGVVNTTISINVNGARPNLSYKFWVKSNSADWQTIQEWSANNVCIWTPTISGLHKLVVWTTDDVNNSCTGMTGATYWAGSPPPQLMSTDTLRSIIQTGGTSVGATNRLLIVDIRSSSDFIQSHIKDALSAPLDLFADGSNPLYTNGFDELSTTASTALADSWLAHILINQLANDFVTTYQNSQIVFYGDTSSSADLAARIAARIGYQNTYYLTVGYPTWAMFYSAETQQYYTGVESVDESGGSFVMTGYINNTNFEDVSTRGTHHCIVYHGGGLASNGMLLSNMAPFCFQEILTYLGASPEGNMAEGIYYGDMDEWASKYPDGEEIEFTVSWDGAGRFYGIDEIFEERPSEFQPDPESFSPVGMEARIGGTRNSNLLWNPGCIFCWYACVCGITSNARANENTWFADGGIYDLMNYPNDPRNFYAGRYYPNMDILPGAGTPIKIKVTRAR